MNLLKSLFQYICQWLTALKIMYQFICEPDRLTGVHRQTYENFIKSIQLGDKSSPAYRREVLGEDIADALEAFISSDADLSPDELNLSRDDLEYGRLDPPEYENGRDRTSTIWFSNPGPLQDYLRQLHEQLMLEEAFSPYLITLLREKGLDRVAVYKKAGIDRKLFSKIISRPEYTPSKKTVLSLAIAMELDLDETRALLEKAGYALSRSILTDVIVTFFISRGIYDIHLISRALDCYGRKLRSRGETDYGF